MEKRHAKEKNNTKFVQHIYSRSLLTRKITLPFNVVGENLQEVFNAYINEHFDGKCQAEGFIKRDSCKMVRYSSGLIVGGHSVMFEILFECEICYPIAGMILQCIVKSVVKSGIKAEIANEVPSPILAFVAKEHHYDNAHFNSIQPGDIIHVRVIGNRFELNDKFISVIGELVILRDTNTKKDIPKDMQKMIIK